MMHPFYELLSRYLVTREEELIHLHVVGLEHLAIFLRQSVEGRLDGVVLVEVISVGVGVSFFMVEVVDYPAEWSKYVCTRIKQKAGSSCSKQEN
jgi:hypothetical protein